MSLSIPQNTVVLDTYKPGKLKPTKKKCIGIHSKEPNILQNCLTNAS